MHCPYDSYRLFANHTGASLSQWDPLYFRYSLGIAQLRLLGIQHTPNSKALCVLLQVCGPRPPCLLGPEQENGAWLETQLTTNALSPASSLCVHSKHPSGSWVSVSKSSPSPTCYSPWHQALRCLSPRTAHPPVTAPDICIRPFNPEMQTVSKASLKKTGSVATSLKVFRNVICFFSTL